MLAVGRVKCVNLASCCPFVLELCSPHRRVLVWFVEAVTVFVCPRNIQVDSPYDISRAPDELHYTYLDTFGRPVIVAYKKNLVEQHIQDIVVSGSAVCGWGCGQDVSCSSLTFAYLCPGSHAGALHVQQGSHAAGAAAGRGRLLHPVLHRHHLRPSGLFHHQGTLLSSSVSGVLVPP